MAERLVRLAGGVGNCLGQAEDAADKGELKWALKMADVVLDCRHSNNASASASDERKAREIKSRCLRALGEQGWINHHSISRIWLANMKSCQMCC